MSTAFQCPGSVLNPHTEQCPSTHKYALQVKPLKGKEGRANQRQVGGLFLVNEKKESGKNILNEPGNQSCTKKLQL